MVDPFSWIFKENKCQLEKEHGKYMKPDKFKKS